MFIFAYLMKELSVTQYAKLLTITRQAVLSQISEGRLASNVTARKVGNTWVLSIKESTKNATK